MWEWVDPGMQARMCLHPAAPRNLCCPEAAALARNAREAASRMGALGIEPSIIEHRASSMAHGASREATRRRAPWGGQRTGSGQRVAGGWRRPLLCAAVMHWIARTASGQISRCKAARWVLPSMSMAIQAIAARAGAPASHVDEGASHRPAGWGADWGVQSAVRSTASSRPQADGADGGQAAKACVKATMGSLGNGVV
jgi:hypothetical protein